MIKFLSMAALVLVGAMTAGCSGNEEIIIEEAQLPSVTDKVVTLKTTVNFDSDNATTRALSANGKKTFAEGDQIAVVYQSSENKMVKAVSKALRKEDIKDGGKSATITVTLTNILPKSQVKFHYPASMLAEEYPALRDDALESQDGTLSHVSTVDYCASAGYDLTADGELPASVTLVNRIAVCAFTVIGNDGTTDITNTITQLTISGGYDTYTVNRSATAGPIYVAMWYVASDETITITATDGTNNYTKEVTGKELLAGHFYPVTIMFGSGKTEVSAELTGYGTADEQVWQ